MTADEKELIKLFVAKATELEANGVVFPVIFDIDVSRYINRDNRIYNASMFKDAINNSDLGTATINDNHITVRLSQPLTRAQYQAIFDNRAAVSIGPIIDEDVHHDE
jgi:hypothetical protein